LHFPFSSVSLNGDRPKCDAPQLHDRCLETQLKPELLERSCSGAGVPLTLRMHEGYDHSYFFISTFIEDHLRWHAQRLGMDV